MGNLPADYASSEAAVFAAEKAYQEALEIRRKLAQENPQTFLSDVGMTLNNLAVLQRAKNEFDKAEKAYQEALV